MKHRLTFLSGGRKQNRISGAVFRARLFSAGKALILASENTLFDIVDNGRDAQAAARRGGDGVLSITTKLVCLSHSSLCVTNYVSL